MHYTVIIIPIDPDFWIGNVRLSIMKLLLTPDHISYIGRTKLFGDMLFLSLSGSGIAFEYKGAGLTFTLTAGSAGSIPGNDVNYARVAVYLNDERIIDTQLSKPETLLKITPPDPSIPSIVRIIKLSECAMSLVGINPPEIAEEDLVKPLSPKEHKIEFIGDSITCGYGIDDEDPLHPFSTATEDVTKAFAYKTAAALNAEYSMFSISGFGIISGYTPDPAVKVPEARIPAFYESMGFSYDRLPHIPAPMDIKWDFDSFRPDAIVINLGTTADSFCQDAADRQQEFTQEYVTFLQTVREKNPEARIFCVLGLMGDRLFPCVQEAVCRYRSLTGDSFITAVHLPEQDASIGFVSDYHPLESAHDKAAHVLIQAIRETLDWK